MQNTGSDYQLQLATTSITGLFKMLLGMLVLGLLVAAIELCLRSKRDAERNKVTPVCAARHRLCQMQIRVAFINRLCCLAVFADDCLSSAEDQRGRAVEAQQRVWRGLVAGSRET